MNIRAVQNSLAGIVLPLADENITVARQIAELSVQQVRAQAPAKVGGGVGDCDAYRVASGFVPDEKSIAVGTTIRRGAEVYNEVVVKLIREARVNRLTSFSKEAGFAAGNLHNQSLIVLRTYGFVAVRLNES